MNRAQRSPGHQKDSDCQNSHAMQGTKVQNQSTSFSSNLSSSKDVGKYSTVFASKKNHEPSQKTPCPVICTQGTLQQVLKGLSENKQRDEPAITPPTLFNKTENGNCHDSGVGNHSSLNASGLNDEEARFPVLLCNEDLSEGENGKGTQFKSIHVPEQCYPGNFPEFVEEFKDVGESKTTFRCKVCKKTKPDRSGLIQHIESAHFPGTFVHTCKFCDKAVKTKSALNSHLHSCKNRFFQVNNNNNKHAS